MKKVLTIAVIFVALPAVAYAASVHLKGGRNAEPEFTDDGLTLIADGELAGLGNEDVWITLEATGFPTAVCINPSEKDGKDQQPPGQNPPPVTLIGVQPIPREEIKNGTTPFRVTTEAPASPVPGAPHCPNPNWAEIITDVSFSHATITVEQPLGTVVMVVDCVIEPSSLDGFVPKGDVDCMQIQF
jgi:hypothetical protein